ncbi:acidic repeat-containing protein isoform X2 [Varanus komodoensis]|uniref:acidic repeat-containing protein isoform X2 n=1 Tax=Varanus komodoensis TaxID=61221 RepID=UPI001CF7A2C5|nr:acidic repeat-containing protein isoform X2 [Varanus komodoensis]
MAQQKISAGCMLQKTKSSASSDSDEEFEKFLSKMKTPKASTCCTPRSQMRSLTNSKENFFHYLTSKYGPTKNAAFSDSDDDSVFAQGTPRNSHQPRQLSDQQCALMTFPPAALRDGTDSSPSEGKQAPSQEHVEGTVRGPCQPRSCGTLESGSSDEEMDGLLVRIQRRGLFPARKSSSAQKTTPEQRNVRPFLENFHPAVKSENGCLTQARPVPDRSISTQLPKGKVLVDVGQIRGLCQVKGCFLKELSDPESQQSKHFWSKKEELAQNLYDLYNRSVFEQKLPQRMEIIWNKKMRKTAGCCITGQVKDPAGQRYAKIMLSEKVCDSADRLRDTMIHELCHAATWLIHGLQDGHGRFWSFYAKKSSMIHPELPVVSRCHNYEIKYKFTYECSKCKNTIGRHSRSLDVERFVCAFCRGKFVLCQPTWKDGTPATKPLAPFAKYVKENYGSTKCSQQDPSHGAIMKKLSADFAAQASLHNPRLPSVKD